MKRCMYVLLVLTGLLFLPAPCVFAAAGDTAPAGVAIAQNATPPVDLSAGDIDPDFMPRPAKRLTLAERLSLQNAICALWHNSMKQSPAPVERLDLMELDAPDHIFIDQGSGFYFENGEWVFEGLIRQMSPDNTGIEKISAIQYFNVRFTQRESGKFFASTIHFGDVGAS